MISSVVARTTSEFPGSNSWALLASHAGIELGEHLDGAYLPLTIEADSAANLEAIHDWIQRLVGIEMLDVIFVSFDEIQAEGPGTEPNIHAR